MEGKMTIQLYDATTMNEVHQTNDKNLITGFYKKMIETMMRHSYFSPLSGSIYTLLSTFYPLVAAKGILLFDAAQTESTDTIFPTSGACIGHAGGDYSGADPYRGDYNASESGAITNGYKFVWDFATDKANGMIRSACLTSEIGGNIGYKSNEYQSATACAGINEPVAATSVMPQASFTGVSTSSLLVGVNRVNADLYWQEGVSGTIKLHRTKKTDMAALGFSTPQVTTYLDYVGKTLGTYEYLFLNMIGETLYGLLYNYNTQVSYLKTYDFNLNELTSIQLAIGYPINYSAQRNTWGKANGILFVKSATANLINRYNATTGAFIDQLTISSITYVGQFDDNLVWMAKDTYNASACYSYYLHNGTDMYGEFTDKCDSSYDYGVNGIRIWRDNGLQTPFVIHAGRYYIKGGLWRPCFFSVNNLASPVLKTNANTMKVTYQITW